MAIVVGDYGDSKILSMITGRRLFAFGLGGNNGAQGDTLCLRLYRSTSRLGVTAPNSTSPTKADTYRNYLGTGPQPTAMLATNWIMLAPATWTMTTTNRGAGDTVAATNAQQTFTYAAGSGDTAQGYLITTRGSSVYTGADTILFWVEKFTDGPYTIPAGGGTVKITPKVIMS